jgi:hypothetical protein
LRRTVCRPCARGWSQFYEAKLLLAHATWIEAEILFAEGKKIAADSPIFFGAAEKKAPKKIIVSVRGGGNFW